MGKRTRVKLYDEDLKKIIHDHLLLYHWPQAKEGQRTEIRLSCVLETREFYADCELLDPK